ncbi:GspE/PulE family protein [Chlamydiifrater phoenicopteri]|uniref:GspE/PulE family protein n=1 Tax=Chlamydiifrater phoenicopteri TaxID=2681469 RepID=UPI001FE68C60|nr:GspE/PulE family protein [Chlamydiifrater phoenicopteri]
MMEDTSNSARALSTETGEGLVSSSLLEKVPYLFLKKHLLLILEETETGVRVATSDPSNYSAIDQLKLLIGKPIVVQKSTEEFILKGLRELYKPKDEGDSKFLSQMAQTKVEHTENIEDLLDKKGEDVPVIRFLNLIFKEAIEQRASDIHFEPTDKGVLIRYRIDGMLYERHTSSMEFKASLVTRIKVLAKLDIAERRLPQDGRIKLHIGGREIDMRVSTVPVINGERVVLRVLDKQSVVLDVDALGMPSMVRESFKDVISYPEGIILVTGPTGSGKTTTLYSILKHLSSGFTNIMTIEDPPEYKLPNISQIAVKPKIGLTFSQGLRHLLRQDPDVLMVGEIRDAETAEIAIQAALTGHLVVSTLHTNDAVSAIPRLVDMGIEPYLLSATVIGVVAQRLVRRICPHCKASCPMDEVARSFLEQQGAKSKKKFSTLSYGQGCELCFGVGYKHRHGIYELLRPDATFRSEVAARSPYHVLKATAEKGGFRSLVHHGVELVLSGETTVDEVLRVTKKYD